MSLSDPFLSHAAAGRLRACRDALAVLCALAAACIPSDEPFELPPADDMQAQPEPAAPASPPGPADSAGGAQNASEAGAGQVPAPGAASTVADGGAPSATPGAGNPAGFPFGPGPAAPGTPMSAGLDGGVPDFGLPLPSDDAGVSLACAAEFATCVLLDVSASGACLDAYADCEPGFRGDADAGLNGECATHFSACVLSNPLDFASCFPVLIDCE